MTAPEASREKNSIPGTAKAASSCLLCVSRWLSASLAPLITRKNPFVSLCDAVNSSVHLLIAFVPSQGLSYFLTSTFGAPAFVLPQFSPADLIRAG